MSTFIHQALSITKLREELKYPKYIRCGDFRAERVEYCPGTYYYICPMLEDMTFKTPERFIDFCATAYEVEHELCQPLL